MPIIPDRLKVIAMCCACVGSAGWLAPAAQGQIPVGVEARLRISATTVPPGQPVEIEFLLINNTSETAVLKVPDVQSDPAVEAAGLPLEHVFSGPGFRGVTIRTDFGRTFEDAHGYQPPGRAARITLPPGGIVGVKLNLSEYYPALLTPGIYRLVWQPYGGALISNQLSISVAARKRAVIITDHGTMTVDLFYEDAPHHVDNFIELAQSGFYNQKVFHKIQPGFYIQGGCPNGDGSGIRLDGKKLVAEFNERPVEKGSVCMARLESDPDSASCQFIIANTRIPRWDGRYTVFGHLVGAESFATLESLMSTPSDQAEDLGRPLKRLHIRTIRIIDVPPEDAWGGFAPGVSSGRAP